jgi:thiamine kinase-like enzyme
MSKKITSKEAKEALHTLTINFNSYEVVLQFIAQFEQLEKELLQVKLSKDNAYQSLTDLQQKYDGLAQKYELNKNNATSESLTADREMDLRLEVEEEVKALLKKTKELEKEVSTWKNLYEGACDDVKCLFEEKKELRKEYKYQEAHVEKIEKQLASCHDYILELKGEK